MLYALRYYAWGATRHVCAHARWLVVGARLGEAFQSAADPCRSWLAGEGGVSVARDVGFDGLIASRLAPTGGSSVNTGFVCGKDQSVGVSLLAMAECQLSWMLDLMASSRASPLPQGIFSEHGICVWQRSKCGSGLAREDGRSGNTYLRSENSPPTDSTSPPAAPAPYKPATSPAGSPPLAGSAC